MTTITQSPSLSAMIAEFLQKGGEITRCGARHAASAAPREHTGGLDRYQFRAFVRYSKEG